MTSIDDELQTPTVRDTATVTVTTPVDGSTRRRARKAPTKRPKQVVAEAHLRVDKRVMDAAKAAMKPGQRIVLVSTTEVLVVNK
jgi:hypothetical protein